MAKLVLGILASTRGTDLQAVIDAIEDRSLNAEIACVISNKENAFALERARKHGIEAIFLNPNEFESRQGFDEKLVDLFRARKVGLVLLIGFSWILGKPFLDAFYEKAWNIHPSLLPAFRGWNLNVFSAVLKAKVKKTGCTLHIVSDKLDAGQVIATKEVPVLKTDSIDSLKKKVQAAEQEVILKQLKKFVTGK